MSDDVSRHALIMNALEAATALAQLDAAGPLPAPTLVPLVPIDPADPPPCLPTLRGWLVPLVPIAPVPLRPYFVFY